MTDFEKTYQNYNPRQTALDEARALLTAAAKAAMADGALPEAELPTFIVEIPADVKNGDIASNIAMAGARTWRKAPKMIADALIAHLPALDGGVFAKVEVAGPGFINLFLAPSFWAGVVLGACSNKEYGRTDHGKGAKYNVEFVSANPTGPMHMGNARGGALGDCLAAVLDWSGYDVTREFYINDAGNQIQKFGKSLAVRYLQQFCGEEAYPLPAECYQGGDIKVLAGEFAETNSTLYLAPLPWSVRPYSLLEQAPSTTLAQKEGARNRLMKPGPATSTLANTLCSMDGRWARRASAIILGALRQVRAPAMARLEAMSPFLVSAGISTIKAGSSASARVPSAIAALAASVSRARASASAAARGL